MMHTTVLLCLLIAFGIASGAKQGEQKVQLDPAKRQKLLQIGVLCVGETGVDLSVIAHFGDGKYKDDEKVKKFFYCAFKKTGISTKSGQIRTDRMLDIYPESVDKAVLKKVIEECESEAKEPMDKVFNFFKCFQHKTPVHVQLMR